MPIFHSNAYTYVEWSDIKNFKILHRSHLNMLDITSKFLAVFMVFKTGKFISIMLPRTLLLCQISHIIITNIDF